MPEISRGQLLDLPAEVGQRLTNERQSDFLARLMREVKTSRGSSAEHCDTRSGAQECNPCCLVQTCQELVGNNNDLPHTVGNPV